MIFTDRKITIRNGKSSIDAPVILYRGDYEVSIKFTIMESKFRFKSGVNLVDSEKASHGQLAILAPYGGNVFSEIVKCEDGTVTFTLTKEMIDQLEEVGLYSFQIRLFDYYRESRVSIPPVEFGIEVREPVASEDHDNEVNNAIVGYSIAKVVDGLNEDVPDTCDEDGQYNKTNWKTGDRISQGKLNKIEDALDEINRNEIYDKNALNKQMTSNFNVLTSQLEHIENKKADKQTTNNLQDQINNLILENINGEGSNIEVVQARGDFKILNDRLNLNDEIISDISIEEIKGINILDSLDARIEVGKNLNGLTGETNSDSKYILTYYVPVKNNSYYLLSGKSSNNSWGRTLKYGCNYSLFDGDKKIINGVNNYSPSVGSSPNLINTNNETKYIRIAMPYSENVTLETFIQNEVMLFETTLETCREDEKKAFEDYVGCRRVTLENVGEDIKAEFNYAKENINNIKSNINEISEVIVSENLFDVNKCEIGKTIDGNTNSITKNSKSVLSGYCEIESNKKYLITGYSSSNSWGRTLKYSINYAFYDENREYLSGENYFNFTLTGTIKLLTVPSNAKYIRFSIPYSRDLTFDEVLNSQLMLFETTDETCTIDEKMSFVEYFNTRRITMNNLSEDVKEMLFKKANQNELMKLKDKYRYLVPTFRGSIKNSLILLGTNDLKRFDLIAEQGVYTVKNPTSKCLRDPSIIQIDDYYYLVYTTCGFEQGNEVGFCRTKDFKNYEELDNIPIANPEGTGDFYYVWAPAWFRDIDGSLYILSACSVDSTSFYTYISKYDETTHTIVSTHKTNVKSIDAHVYYENSKFYMFVGGAFMWKSDTLLGTWTGISGNNLQYTGYEADFAVRLEDGSWRLYMQELPQTHGSAHMVYVDAPSIEGTWSEPKQVEYTKKALDYIRSINKNDENTEYYHWTIFDFNRTLGNNNYFKS